MQDHPFVFLTGSNREGKQAATQIPVLTEQRNGELYILGHIMRNTDHHEAFMDNPQALAVFTGPHAYISASWYTEPQNGSTWNYMSVYASGKLTFLPQEGLISLLRRMSLLFEGNNISSPTVYDNLPVEYIRKMLPAIVAFEMKVESLENVFKLSQNRDEISYRNIISSLEKIEAFQTSISGEMKKRLNQLFPLKDEPVRKTE